MSLKKAIEEAARRAGIAFEEEDVVVGTSWTDLIEIIGGGILCLEVENSVQTLNGFSINVKMHENSPWLAILQDTDFDTATYTMLYCSTTGPHELGVGSCIVIVNLRNVYAFKLVAKAAIAGAVTSVRGNYNG